MVDYKSLSKENSKKAIIRCIELMGLKNQNKIEEIKENIYCHVNTRGNKKYFIALYGWNKYKNWFDKNKENEIKFYKVNGFYVVRLKENY